MIESLIHRAEAILPSSVKKVLKRLLLAMPLASFNFIENKVAKHTKPIYLVHTGEQEAPGKAHLNMWLPVLIQYQEKQDLPFAVIVRSKSLYKWLDKNYPNVASFFCRRLSDIEEVVKKHPEIMLCLHPSTTQRMMHMVSMEKMTHAWIGHGDSDKLSSVRKAMRMCDEVWVAGQAHIDRFNNSDIDFSSLKFRVVGRPQIKTLLHTTIQHNQNKILYLPTWEGAVQAANYSSLETISRHLPSIALENSFSIDSKLHPMTGHRSLVLKKIEKELSRVSNKHFKALKKDYDLTAILGNYSAFICDNSAVITECLATQKPIFLYIPKNREIVLAQSKIPYTDYCYTFSTPAELQAKIQEVLTHNNDRLGSKRREALAYNIDVSKTLEHGFCSAIKEVLDF